MISVGANEAKLELEKKVGQLQNKLEEKLRIIQDLEMRTETVSHLISVNNLFIPLSIIIT